MSASPGQHGAEEAQLGIDTRALFGRLRRVGVWAVATWLGLFLAWASFAPISGAVVGSGVVKVEANRLTVSHRDGGQVAQLLVREGQQVERGQPLLVLEDARIDASVELLRVQLQAERIRLHRLEAEQALKLDWMSPVLSDEAATWPRVLAALRSEQQAFQARREALQAQQSSVRLQLANLAQETSAYERDIVASEQALVLAREELQSNEQLLAENFINRSRVIALRRNVAETEARIEGRRAELAQARQRRVETAGRGEDLRLAYVQSAAEEARESNARLVDLEERLRASADAANRQVVTAPEAGRLIDLRVNTVGSAVGPREPIVDIVPQGRRLLVEARLPPHTISDVAVGMPAEVQLLSMRQRFSGTLRAEVVHVADDAITDPRTGSDHLLVQVQLLPQAVATLGDPEQNGVLQPGMTAEVYIKTTERSAMAFLLDPLLMAMRRSLREY